MKIASILAVYCSANLQVGNLPSRTCPPEGGRYTNLNAFPLAFAGQNDIFSGRSEYRKFTGQKNGLNALLSAFRVKTESTTKELGRFG